LDQFSVVKKGYSPEEVDKYISTLEQVITSYKDKDNAIKNAIISAQLAADNIVKNAKLQANEYKSQIATELEKVRKEINIQRDRIQSFQYQYNELVRKHLVEFDQSEMQRLNNTLDDVDKLVVHLMEADIVLPEERAAMEAAAAAAVVETQVEQVSEES